MLTITCLTLALVAADTPARVIAEPVPTLRSARPAPILPPPPRIRREETSAQAPAPTRAPTPATPSATVASSPASAAPLPAPTAEAAAAVPVTSAAPPPATSLSASTTSPAPPAPAAASTLPAASTPPPTTESSRSRLVLNRARTLFNALRAFDAGDFATAESICVEVLRHYPGDTAAMTIAGAALIKAGRAREAAEIFEEYTRLFPLEALAHFYKGLSYHLLGDRDRAIASYWAARLLDPSLEAARANLKQITEAD